MTNNLKTIETLIAERDQIDADIARIEGMRERRKVINLELSKAMGLSAPAKKRGRPSKQAELPV